MSILKQDYTIDTDWEGMQYLGLTLDWDYNKRKVHLSMLGYIENALIRFGHEPARQTTDATISPHNSHLRRDSTIN
jgi:hypothetical protein